MNSFCACAVQLDIMLYCWNVEQTQLSTLGLIRFIDSDGGLINLREKLTFAPTSREFIVSVINHTGCVTGEAQWPNYT